MQKQTKIKYKAGHESTIVWTLVDYFCPSCGAKALWKQDYYTGNAFLCLACKNIFAILENDINEKEQVLKQLRAEG